VKLIGGGSPCDSPSPFYSKFKFLKLHHLHRIEVAKFVHLFINNSTTVFPIPFLITSLKPIINQVSNYSTRATARYSNLFNPRYRINLLQHSIKYQGVKSGMIFVQKFLNYQNHQNLQRN